MKDFTAWGKEKTKIENNKKYTKVFHEQEIWWCSIGLNIGSEQDGKNNNYERPVLVIKKFNDVTAWVTPLSSKVKTGKYFVSLSWKGIISTVLLSQMKLVSIKRFQRYIRKITPHQFEEIKTQIIDILKN